LGGCKERRADSAEDLTPCLGGDADAAEAMHDAVARNNLSPAGGLCSRACWRPKRRRRWRPIADTG
jgi:hypothetical protein